jgi:hypothetical protein
LLVVKTAVIIPPRVKNIPDGDPTKELNFQTEHQKTFTVFPQSVYQNRKVSGPTKIKSHILPQAAVDFTTTAASAFAARPRSSGKKGDCIAAVNESSITFGESTNNPNIRQRQSLTSFQLDFKAPAIDGTRQRTSRHPAKEKTTSKACFDWNQGRKEDVESTSKHDYPSWSSEKETTKSAREAYARISKTGRLSNVRLGDTRIQHNHTIAQSSFKPSSFSDDTGYKKATNSQVSSITFGTTHRDYSQSSHIAEFPVYYYAAQKAIEKTFVLENAPTDLKIQSEFPGVMTSLASGPISTTSHSHYTEKSNVDRKLGKALVGATNRVLFPITDKPREYSTTGHESYRMREGLFGGSVGPTGPRQYQPLRFGDDRIDTFYRKFPMVVRA